MNENVRVSICIPNYNNARYLKDCIDSAVSQNFQNYEVIVYDDGSTDASPEIIAHYGGRIRYLNAAQNRGQPYATNKVVDMAQGEYVLILHSDDQLLPNALADLFELFNMHPDAVMAVGERIEINGSDETRHIAPFYDANYRIPGIKQAKIFMFSSFLPCQVLFRKKVFKAAGGVDPNYIVNLDGLLWFKLSLHGDVLYRQNEVSIYRYHSENTTSGVNHSTNGMIDLYLTIRRMIELSKDNAYLSSFHEAAIKRAGDLILRYATRVAHEGNIELAKRQMLLAQYFNPDLTGSKALAELSGKIESGEILKPVKFKDEILRAASYQPPEGSIELKIRSLV